MRLNPEQRVSFPLSFMLHYASDSAGAGLDVGRCIVRETPRTTPAMRRDLLVRRSLAERNTGQVMMWAAAGDWI
jgi:hypothetical protein